MKKLICFFFGHKVDKFHNHDGYDFCDRCGSDEYYDSGEMSNSWTNTLPYQYKLFKNKIKNRSESIIKIFQKEELPF